MRNQYRHGDLLLRQVSTSPDYFSERQDGVLLEGEATGHAHRVDEHSTVLSYHGELFVRVHAPSALTHEEHATIVLPPGLYQVVRQRVRDVQQGAWSGVTRWVED